MLVKLSLCLPKTPFQWQVKASAGLTIIANVAIATGPALLGGPRSSAINLFYYIIYNIFFSLRSQYFAKFAKSSKRRFLIERCLYPEILVWFFLYSYVANGIGLRSSVSTIHSPCHVTVRTGESKDSSTDPLSAPVLPTGIYIYTKFQNFGVFLNCLVYKFLIWYIWKIWYIFGIFLSEGVFETLHQIIYSVAKHE